MNVGRKRERKKRERKRERKKKRERERVLPQLETTIAFLPSFCTLPSLFFSRKGHRCVPASCKCNKCFVRSFSNLNELPHVPGMTSFPTTFLSSSNTAKRTIPRIQRYSGAFFFRFRVQSLLEYSIQTSFPIFHFDRISFDVYNCIYY